MDDLINRQSDYIAEVSKKSDTIYRADAIDTLEREKTYSTAYKDGYAQTDIFKQYNMGLTDGIKALNKLPSAQPEQQWIPLGRPMNSGRYLVTLRQKFEGEESYRVLIMRLNEGHWVLPKHFPEWINEEMEQEVLAWMPLPEPYKEDQCNGCSYLDGACVGEGCGKLTERKDGEQE